MGYDFSRAISEFFHDAVMREKLSRSTYQSLRRSIDEGAPLEPDVAEVVASAMKALGSGTGRQSFYPLVPADDYLYCRKARFFSGSYQGRPGNTGVFRKGIDCRGTGCLIFPQRRSAQHL